MIVRDYKTEDEARLRELFALQSFEYEFPDFDKMLLCRTVTNGDRPIMTAALKPTAEAFLLLDPEWQTPGLRMAALKALHEDIRKLLLPMNIPEVHTWLPPEFEKTFGRRLIRNFGWQPAEWKCYFKKVT